VRYLVPDPEQTDLPHTENHLFVRLTGSLASGRARPETPSVSCDKMQINASRTEPWLSHEIEEPSKNPRASTRDNILASRSHFPPLIRGAQNPVLWGVQPKVVGPVEAMVLLRLAMARSANDLYTVLGSRNVWL
jgi:hypothetical protein